VFQKVIIVVFFSLPKQINIIFFNEKDYEYVTRLPALPRGKKIGYKIILFFQGGRLWQYTMMN
jgi:hypothetical protein